MFIFWECIDMYGMRELKKDSLEVFLNFDC